MQQTPSTFCELGVSQHLIGFAHTQWTCCTYILFCLPASTDFPLMGRTVVISRTMRKVFGWPIEMGLTPITCALTSFLSRYGFSSEDVRELLRLRIPRSTIAEKIVYLEQNWCWQEVKVRDVIKKDRHLLERKPASIISNMRKLDRKWGRHAAVDALRRDSYALMRNPSRMIASVHEIGEFMSSEFGLEAPPHGSWMGSRIYKTSLKQVRCVEKWHPVNHYVFLPTCCMPDLPGFWSLHNSRAAFCLLLPTPTSKGVPISVFIFSLCFCTDFL